MDASGVRTERCLGGLVCPSSLCSQRPQGEDRNRHRDYLWNFITAGSYSRLLAFQSACITLFAYGSLFVAERAQYYEGNLRVNLSAARSSSLALLIWHG